MHRRVNRKSLTVTAVRLSGEKSQSTKKETIMANFTEIQVGDQPIFNFGEHPVRVIMRDGQPWFVAADVCAALKLDVTAIRKLDEDEKGLHSMQTPGGIQNLTVITEPGLYTMALRCRDALKPGTVPYRFRKWVTSEVLPSIRKTGGYQQPANFKGALTASGQVAAMVQTAVFDSVLAGGSDWKYGRWMVSFITDSKEAIPAIACKINPEAVVMTLAQLARAIAVPGDMMPSNVELANLARACNDRLSQRLMHQEGRQVAA